MTEFDKDCEIGMLEENEYPLGSGLRAPVKGNLESILWHKIANSNILIEASKFLLHHFEESLLNHRQLKSVINDDLKVGFEEKLSYPYRVNPLGYYWKDKWPRKKESCAESFSIKEGYWDKRLEITTGVAKTLVAMQSSEKQNIYRDLNPSSILLEETPKSFLDDTPHNSTAKVNLMDGGECTTLNVLEDLSQAGKTELKIKATQHALEQMRLMRQEGYVEGAFQAKSQNNKGGKNKKKQNKDNKLGGFASSNKNSQSSNTHVFSPCPYCKKTNHPQNKCWWRPDAKCHKCGQLGHVERICKTQQQQREANVIKDQLQEEQLFVVSCFATNSSTESWLIDSGCTNHMTYDRELFKELDETTISKVRIGNGAHIAVKSKGTVAIEGHTGLKLIYDVLYVPEINQNLLSVTQLLEKGYKVLFEDKNCVIKDAKDKEVFKVQMKGKSFALDLMKEEHASVHREDNITVLWHKRLGHFYHITLLYMKNNNLVKGLPELEEESPKCAACQYGKQTRIPFQQNKTWRAIQRLQLIHTDVGGPMKTPSLNNSYSSTSKAYKIYLPQRNKVIVSRDVQFFELDNWSWENDKKLEVEENDDTDDENVRGTRSLSDIYQMCNIAVMEPAGYEEAANDQKWITAMKDELKIIEKNQTWELVDRPEHKKAIGVKLDTIRMSLALVAQQGWVIHQMDVKSTFLNGYLEEEIFVEQPEGFVFPGQDEKADNEVLVVSLYVDDLLVTGSSKELIDRFKEEMKDVFEMTDLGRMTFFLECKPTATLMNQKEKFCKEDGAEKVDEMLYRSLIGCLMYLTATRPDIMHAVSLLSRYMHCASKIHFQAAKRILRYVKGTIDYGIKFNQVKNFHLHGYSDSDWARCVDDMRSTSGYCFSFGSGIFSWCSKKQEVIAQSTAKAEYVAVAAAVNQALWIKKLMTDLHMEQQEGTQIFVDNQAAISIANNPVFHGKTKHFKIKLYFLRESTNQPSLDIFIAYTRKSQTEAKIRSSQGYWSTNICLTGDKRYYWKNKWLMQKKCLENVHLGEHPASVQQSPRAERLEIVTKICQGLAFLLSSEKQTFKCNLSDFSIAKVSAMENAELTALDMSSVSAQSGKTDMEMKMAQLESGAWRAHDEDEQPLQWPSKSSHLKSTMPDSSLPSIPLPFSYP
ncbi:hypothetical protein KPL71_025767 [Citrus sinensis]|uniref:Uncharacterized protein n=1 Tax=Citrus sinensis TaxID=2711 RepID=A0ACB8HUV3_CITSI|nr:hypothetical protein KPL71_025767 [Citrus sinensis]